MNHKENTVLMIVRLYIAFIMMRTGGSALHPTATVTQTFLPHFKRWKQFRSHNFNISILNKPQHFPLSLFCLQKSDSFDLVLLHIVLVIGAVGPATLRRTVLQQDSVPKYYEKETGTNCRHKPHQAALA